MKFKGAWHTHFLSHALHILKITITFEDFLIIFLGFVDISVSLRSAKKLVGTEVSVYEGLLAVAKI